MQAVGTYAPVAHVVVVVVRTGEAGRDVRVVRWRWPRAEEFRHFAAVQRGGAHTAVKQVPGQPVDGVLGVQEHQDTVFARADLDGGGVLVGAVNVQHMVFHRGRAVPTVNRSRPTTAWTCPNASGSVSSARGVVRR